MLIPARLGRAKSTVQISNMYFKVVAWIFILENIVQVIPLRRHCSTINDLLLVTNSDQTGYRKLSPIYTRPLNQFGSQFKLSWHRVNAKPLYILISYGQTRRIARPAKLL